MRFAKAQLEALERVIDGLEGQNIDSSWGKTRVQLSLLHAKLLKLSEGRPKPKPGIGMERAIAAMRSVLGNNLAVPKNPSDQWRMWQAKRIRDLGLTEEDCKTIARNIMAKWQPPYGFEYCIKAADRLLAETGKKSKESAPAEMDEWE